MTNRIIDVFFYGLFMDVQWLKERGLAPTNPRLARVNDFDLVIGDRATLVPVSDAYACGLVVGMPQDQLLPLYAEPSVRDYLPEAVLAILETDEPVAALCYNLPSVDRDHPNRDYAHRLFDLAKTLNFPGEYLNKIKHLSTP